MRDGVWNDRGAKNSHRQLARKMFWQAHDPDTYQCPDCDRQRGELHRPFEIHHKNGDPLNNSEGNLIGLCRLCHNLREGKKPSIEAIRHLRDGAKEPREDPKTSGRLTTDAHGRPAIKCPECGGGYMHQQRVDVFVREREDADEDAHVVIEYAGGTVSTDHSMNRNPSGRRDGIRIVFECEFCGMKTHTLQIAQHKGNELVSWEDFDE